MKKHLSILLFLITIYGTTVFAASPTIQANNILFTNITSTQMDIAWTNGDGTNRAVFIYLGNSGTANPVDLTTYTANTAYGSGTQADPGWYCVYNGAGSSVTVTGLTGGSTYRVMVTEYNGGAGAEEYLTTSAANNPSNIVTTFTAPGTQTSNISFSSTLTTSTSINWTNGNGSSRAVFIKQAASGSASPVDRTTYTASATFGSGTQILATGWYCVYTGTGTTVSVTGLTAGTAYQVMVVEFNGTWGSGTEGYNTSTNGTNPVNLVTTFTAPNTQATVVSYSATLATSTTISWTNGNGTARAVFVKLANSGSASPIDRSPFSANSVFGTGTQIGVTGWYCVYNGAGTSVSITGLTAGTTYRTMVVEYNGSAGAEGYNTTTNGTNPTNFTTTSIPSAATNILFSNTTNTGTTVNWTNGSGSARAVFVLQGTAGSPTPVDGTTYTANTVFGSGTAIGSWYCVYNGTGASVSITGLTAGTMYRVMVLEYNGSAGFEVYNPATAANNPMNVFTNFLTTVGLPNQGNYAVGISVLPTFIWAPVTGATSYDLEISTDGVNFSVLTSANVLTYSVIEYNQLASATLYNWRVKVNGGLYAGNYSQIWEFTTQNGQVTISSAYPFSTSVNLAWFILPLSNNIKYDIYYSTNNFVTKTTVLDLTSSSYTITGLNPATTYQVLVRAKNNAGTIFVSYSPVVSFTTTGLPTPTLSYPVGGVTTYGNPPSLSWYINGYEVSHTYIVKYWTGAEPIWGGGGVPLGTQTASSGYFDTGSNVTFNTLLATLTPGLTYSWKVYTTNDGGTTVSAPSSTATFAIYSTVPTSPPTPTPSWPTNGSSVYVNPPMLYWYLGTYATGLYFYIEWDLNSGTFSPALGNSGWFADNLYFSIPTSLAPNTYKWRVRSRVGLLGTPGTWSSEASFVIPSSASNILSPNPSAPAGTTVSTLNPTMSWTASTPPALEYHIRISTYSNTDVDGVLNHVTAQSSGWIPGKSSPFNSLSFTPAITLLPGVTYYWQVQSRLTATPTAISRWSYVASFQTAAGSFAVVPIAVVPNFGQPINNTSAVLSWTLPTQSNSYLTYDLQYSKDKDFQTSVSTLKDVNEKVTKITGLDSKTTYYWRVLSKNSNGSISSYSQPAEFSTSAVTGVEKEETIPTEYSLEQNYPNPFNPATIINYSLPENSFVSLKVFDMLGREVRSLVNQDIAAGKHSIEWKADDNNGNKVATGVYVYRIQASNFISTKKMMLIK